MRQPAAHVGGHTRGRFTGTANTSAACNAVCGDITTPTAQPHSATGGQLTSQLASKMHTLLPLAKGQCWKSCDWVYVCACIEAVCLCACAGANAGGMLGSCALVSVLCEPFVHTKAGGTCMCAASRGSVAVMSHLCQHVLHAPLQGMSRIPPCLHPLGLSCCITYPSAVQKGLFPVACRVLPQVPHGWPHYR